MKTIKIATLVILFGAVSVAAQNRQFRPSFAPIGFQGETGNVCVGDFQNPVNCTANDVLIESFSPVSVIETCGDGTFGEAEMILQASVQSNSPDRYDIGLFVSLDANSARDGDNCLHDFFSSAEASFVDLDEDACGDITGGTTLQKTLMQIRFQCVDRDNDGNADLSACSSWDNNSGSVCNGLSDAFPSTPAKCGCQILDLGIPIPVELESFSIER
ncbi:MAG: hypothetical protein R3244_02955 [Thermoanaerobaculia bacterium]|nr:hypothetical protein [Thermoanaerobaculia bacterium]